MPEYPRRDPWFAHKVVRLMIRVCAAQEIGTNGFLLVTVIAHTEDAKRYTDAVTFWNDQLRSILGFSWGQLDRARKRAVAAGWLHYDAGGKGRVGKYWTTIPPQFAGLDAGPVDCDAASIISTNGDDTNAIISTSGERSVREAGEKRDHSSPSPNQDPHGPRSVDQKCAGEEHDTSTRGEEHNTRPKRGEHKTRVVAQANDISQAALAIFNGCGYRGDQGGNLWKVAALQEAGLVGEDEVASACRGAKLNGKNKPAHFYTCLKELLTKRGEDLGALLNGVRIEPQWPKSPPARGSDVVQLNRVQDVRERDPDEVRAQIAALLRKESHP